MQVLSLSDTAGRFLTGHTWEKLAAYSIRL